jgi:hypothetical protein
MQRHTMEPPGRTASLPHVVSSDCMPCHTSSAGGGFLQVAHIWCTDAQLLCCRSNGRLTIDFWQSIASACHQVVTHFHCI